MTTTTELTEVARELGRQKMQNQALEIINNKIREHDTTESQRAVLYTVFTTISELTI